MVLLMAARAALVSFVAVTMVLAPSLGHAALYEPHSWPARLVMLVCLAGTWVSVFALGAARERVSKRAAR